MHHLANTGRAPRPSRTPLQLAIRAAALGLSISMLTPAAAQAEVTGVSSQIQRFDIPAGPLDSALEQFARSANLNLNYDPAQLVAQQSKGLRGSYSSQQALEQLLEGTGLTGIAMEGGYDIRPVPVATSQLDTINVYGRIKNDSLTEIPQTVAVYDRDVMSETSADSVGDIIRLTAGASRSGSSLDMFADDYLIRGFDSEQSTNGLGFRRTDHPTDLANVERIEILKGPASVLYGQMEPGGTINVVTKQPLDYYQASAGVEYGSDNQRRTTLDVTGPVNDVMRARLNVAWQKNEYFVDNLDSERFFIAPNVTVDLTDTTNLTIEGSYSANDWTAIQGGTPVEGSIQSNPNGKYHAGLNPAGPDSYTERNSKDLSIRLTEALTDNIDARFSYAYTRNEADWLEYVPFGLNDDMRTLDRLVFFGKDTYRRDHEVIVDLSGEIETGRLSHTFVAGLNYRDSKQSRPTQLLFASPLDIYNPQYTAVDLSTAPQLRNRSLDSEDRTAAIFVQDRIGLTDRLQVVAGARYTDSEQTQVAIDLSSNSRTEDRLEETDLSTQLGIIYDLTDSTTVYANRSESFVPQQGTTSGRSPLDAEESTQYEAGVRFQLGKVAVNVAGFVIRKENTAISDPLDDDFEVAQGSAESKGIELSAGGYVTPNWKLSMAYGYTDTEIVNSDDAELEGNRFANVPQHTASVQSLYHVPSVQGLSLGGTLGYSSDRFGDDDNSFKLPSYTRLDLSARYAINDELLLDLLLDNALDEEIYSPGSYDGVVREPGRSWTARLTYNF